MNGPVEIALRDALRAGPASRADLRRLCGPLVDAYLARWTKAGAADVRGDGLVVLRVAPLSTERLDAIAARERQRAEAETRREEEAVAREKAAERDRQRRALASQIAAAPAGEARLRVIRDARLLAKAEALLARPVPSSRWSRAQLEEMFGIEIADAA